MQIHPKKVVEGEEKVFEDEAEDMMANSGYRNEDEVLRNKSKRKLLSRQMKQLKKLK